MRTCTSTGSIFVRQSGQYREEHQRIAAAIRAATRTARRPRCATTSPRAARRQMPAFDDAMHHRAGHHLHQRRAVQTLPGRHARERRADGGSVPFRRRRPRSASPEPQAGFGVGRGRTPAPPVRIWCPHGSLRRASLTSRGRTARSAAALRRVDRDRASRREQVVKDRGGCTRCGAGTPRPGQVAPDREPTVEKWRNLGS